MKRFVLFATLALALVAMTAMADTRPQMTRGDFGVHTGGDASVAKASRDTLYLLGGPDRIDGTFETASRGPAWNGWTRVDETFSNDSFWNVTDVNPVSGNYSYWCGTNAPGWDGYGNDWNQVILYTKTVANPASPSTVNWSFALAQASEPSYDYTFVEWNQGGVWQQLGQYDGTRSYNPSFTFSVAAGEYVGAGGNEIQLRIRFYSDGAYSDEDGDYPTNGEGGCKVDDISVTINGSNETDTFESGSPTYWAPFLLPGVGNYAALYNLLQDEDECRSNNTYQVAFVDDGVIVPGTGGTPGQTWRYGPGGWILNNTGGPAGPDFYLNNILISPVINYPAGFAACRIEFEAYRHEELGAYTTWPGIFYQYHVRSVNSGNPADLEDATWADRNFVYYGGPDYIRVGDTVTDLLVTGATHMQLGLRVIEYGYNWGWVGTDGTPAPYFDNAQVKVWNFDGPGIAGRPIDWFQDDFPAIGDIDYANLANNSVRLDCAQNVAQQEDLVNYPGDSMWVDITAVRAGSFVVDYPKMFVRMKANPLFDSYRTNLSQLNDVSTQAGFFADGSTLIEGWVYGDSCYNNVPDPPVYTENRWEFDLPDEAFFFPGDELRWYIEAKDNAFGNIGTTLLPADTSGFAGPGYNLDYPVDYIVRALPSLESATPGDQPSVLFWNDFVGRGGDNEWLFALQQIGYEMGVDYDMYATNGPSSGVGNGIGGRASSVQLEGYNTLLYTSGDLSVNLIANGDFNNDPSNDIAVLTNWFAQGDKKALFTGDEFIRGMRDAGSDGLAFLNRYVPHNYVQNSINPLIGFQSAPVVQVVGGNPIIARVDEWIAYGGCLGINNFDAVQEANGSSAFARFTDTSGNPISTYAAGLYYTQSQENAETVYMPYDLMFIYNAPGWTPPFGYGGVSARAVMLEDILNGFGEIGGSANVGSDVPAGVLSVSNFPNPFNPTTTIKLNLPLAGDVSLKVFNVRGELVRTLVDERMVAGEHSIIWDGKTNSGNQAASGVYFYETRANGEVKINKMALVK